MKLLIDTHVLLCWLTKDPRLSKTAIELIGDANNQILVSSASLWEITIKQSLGRITLSLPELIDGIASNGFEQLPVMFSHCLELSKLPSIHKDPFDRILISQSLSEPAVLLTHDSALKAYGNFVRVI